MTKKLLVAAGLVWVAHVGAHLASAQQKPRGDDTPVATVGGEPITDADLGIRGRLLKLEQQAHQLRLQALENAINRRVLEAVAKKRNLTLEEFLKQEVDGKVAEPAPEEVRGFYLGVRDKLQRRPYEEVRQQLAAQLKTVKILEAREAFLRELRNQTEVVILLQTPRVEVPLAGAPRRGPATAPVTMVVFSDFECSYCKSVQLTLKEVLSNYGDQVSFVYKDLPLQMHPQAQSAAEAARCAHDQGKFWEYHDELYKSAALTVNTYLQIANKLGLATEPFQSCIKSGKYKAAVESSAQEAIAVGADSTPSFFINGIPLSGAQSASAFFKIIDAELAAAKKAK